MWYLWIIGWLIFICLESDFIFIVNLKKKYHFLNYIYVD